MLRLVLLSLSAALALPASAVALELDIVNEFHTSLHHLYLSEVDSHRWGPDQLGDRRRDTVEPGEKFTLTRIAPGRYDLKLVAGDGTECVIGNQRIGSDKAWTVTESTLDHCD